MSKFLISSFLIRNNYNLRADLQYTSKVMSMSTMSVENILRIALCQTTVTSNKNENLATVKSALDKATSGNAKLIVLPEIWNSPYATTSFPIYSELIPEVGQIADITVNPSISLLCEHARNNKVWIIGGSIPEKVIEDNGKEKLYNTCTIINPEGSIVGKHRKVHLFDIDVPGRIKFKESDSLSAGDSVTIFDSPWGKIGVGICYDIRFPELAAIMRQRGCRMLVYPGAFNMVTGPAHWELLQRARAVDNQVYVAACSPARDEKSGYIAWGHSSVISPWGEVVAKAEALPEVLFAELDFEKVENMRQSIPCWFQKRNDIYSIEDKKI